MTTEEKLQHFLSFCIEDSRARSQKMLDDYMEALEKTLDEHKKEAVHRADMQLQIEKDRIKRDINKQLAVEELKIRRELSQKHEELKDMLFVELRNELAAFMETNEYQLLLERQVNRQRNWLGEKNSLSISILLMQIRFPVSPCITVLPLNPANIPLEAEPGL